MQNIRGEKRNTSLSFIFLWNIVFLLLLGGVSLSAQERSSDDLFLDDSFTDQNEEAPPIPDALKEELEEEPEKEPASTLFSLFSIRNTVSYYDTTRETAQNKGNIIYYSPWSNVLQANHLLQYETQSKRFQYNMHYNLYFDARSFEDTTKTENLDTGFAFELQEVNTKIDIIPYTMLFRVGKILQEYGLGYLTSPSSPTLFSYKSNDYFAQNRVFSSVSTLDISPLARSIGSDNEMGYWATELELNFFPIVWRVAYLPLLDTGFIELDRPEHSVLSTIHVSAWDYMQPSALLYWYGTNFFTGLNISLGLNEYLTAHLDVGMSSENPLPVLQQISEVSYGPGINVPHYEIAPKESNSIYTEFLFGINYTPVYEAMALFNIIVELYYNGKGLSQDDWDEQIAISQDIYATYSDVKGIGSISSLSNAYEGILGYKQYYYDPLSVRPFYMVLSLSRDDIFPSTKSNYNAESSIVYSVYDTTFAWKNNFEVEMKDMVAIGSTLEYFFGVAHGSFTELPYRIRLSVYSEFSF